MTSRFIYILPLLVSTNAQFDRCYERIIGGREVNITDIPFQVSLNTISDRHVCGGVVISPRWVLTAAHCVESHEVNVRFASTFSNHSGLLVSVNRSVRHPLYNEKASDYDIALLELVEAIPLDDNFFAVELPLQNESIEDGRCLLVSGWGISGFPVDRLNAVHVPVVNFEECKNVYGSVGRNVTNRMICAGYPEGGMGVCHGDSGGPLVDGRKLIGVVSWGLPPCAGPGFPGVYTRVAAFRNWITQISDV
ncbi:trypsin 5G1-like [Malaya genurostris]|uniref:trypsin 5G1-like n=1 Tax=Malaya genurostris TaxID=325434 RepID=UPI0026F3915C|nr:trypsin 5G1-like [Malaya genurostris]